MPAVPELFSYQDAQVEGAQVDGALSQELVTAHDGGADVGELAVARDLEAELFGVQPDATQPGVGRACGELD